MKLSPHAAMEKHMQVCQVQSDACAICAALNTTIEREREARADWPEEPTVPEPHVPVHELAAQRLAVLKST